MTVWPSGLRRWLQAPVRKGVGSNPTGVTCLRARLCSVLLCRRVRRGALRCGAMSCLGVLCEAVACRVMPCMCVHVCAWPRAVYTWCGAWGRAPACFSGGVSCDTGPLGRGILRTAMRGSGSQPYAQTSDTYMCIFIYIYMYIYIYIYMYICICRRLVPCVIWASARIESHVSLEQSSAARAPKLPRHTSTHSRIQLHVHAKISVGVKRTFMDLQV